MNAFPADSEEKHFALVICCILVRIDMKICFPQRQNQLVHTYRVNGQSCGLSEGKYLVSLAAALVLKG